MHTDEHRLSFLRSGAYRLGNNREWIRRRCAMARQAARGRELNPNYSYPLALIRGFIFGLWLRRMGRR